MAETSQSSGETEANIVESCPIPKPKIKHDWYQTESQVVITVLLKNADKEKVKVSFQSNNLSLSCPIPSSSSEYSLELELRHPVVPEQSTSSVTASKIEVKLKKRDGLRWDKLEATPDQQELKTIPQDASSAASVPVSYPSSCPHRKDWNKIEQEIKKEEAEEKPEGDAALKAMFEKIYGGGSDEVKKAMNKSYMESGGTVLSTNWNQVRTDKVEVKPPDGMEFKKWDS